MKSLNWFTRLSFAAVGVSTSVLLGVDGCSSTLVEDPAFQTLCGDQLCYWEVETGSYRAVPTWSETDKGIELLDTPTRISQTNRDAFVPCIEFDTIANVDDSAEVSFGLDFNANGSIDYRFSIPAGTWKPTKTVVAAPTFYRGIRFVIEKNGEGTAVLAQSRIVSAESCPGTKVVLQRTGEGGACESDQNCKPGLYCTSSYRGVCSVPGHTANGGQCYVDEDCASATCIDGICEPGLTSDDSGTDATP